MNSFQWIIIKEIYLDVLVCTVLLSDALIVKNASGSFA